MKKLTRTLKSIGAIVLALALAITPMPGRTADVKAEKKESYTIKIDGYTKSTGKIKLIRQEEETTEPQEETTTGEGETTTEAEHKDKEATENITNGEATFSGFVYTEDKYDIEVTGLDGIKDYSKKNIVLSGDSYTVTGLKKEILIKGYVYGEKEQSSPYVYDVPIKDVEVKYTFKNKQDETETKTVKTNDSGYYTFNVFQGDSFDVNYKVPNSDKIYGNQSKSLTGLSFTDDENTIEDIQFNLGERSIKNGSDNTIKVNGTSLDTGETKSVKYGDDVEVKVYALYNKKIDDIYVDNQKVTDITEITDPSDGVGYVFNINSIKDSCEIDVDNSDLDTLEYFTANDTGSITAQTPGGGKTYHYVAVDSEKERVSNNKIINGADAISNSNTVSLGLDGITTKREDYKQKIFKAYVVRNGRVVSNSVITHIYYDSAKPVIDQVQIYRNSAEYDDLFTTGKMYFYKNKITIKVKATDRGNTDEKVAGLKHAQVFDDASKYPTASFDNNGWASIEVDRDSITEEGWYLSKVLKIRVNDNAGNVGEETTSGEKFVTNLLLMERVKPTIDDPIYDAAGEKQKSPDADIFSGDVDVKLVVHDDEGNAVDADSDEAAFKKKISGIYSITATDINNNDEEIALTQVEDTPEDNITTEDSTESQKIYSKKTVKFNTSQAKTKKGMYKIKVVAVDNATNESKETIIRIGKDTEKPYIDKMTFHSVGYKKDGEVKESAETSKDYWEHYVDTDKYGYYFRKETKVYVDAIDEETEDSAASGVAKVEYYLLEDGKSESDVEKKYAEKEGDNFYFIVPAGFRGKIFARAIDYVGNGKKDDDQFVTPEGTIVETEKEHNEQKAPHINIVLDPSVGTDAKGNDLYSKNTKAKITITDVTSGIRQVDVGIVSPIDDKKQAGSVIVKNAGTSEKIKYSGDEDVTNKQEYSLADSGNWNADKKDGNLINVLSNTLTISNNSNDIKIMVKMTDRAGNTSTKTKVISIDKTAPKVVVKMADNDDSQFAGYFKTNRKYDIYVYERNISKKNVKMTVKRRDDYDTKHNVNMSHNFKYIGKTMLDDAEVYVYKKSGTFKAEGEYTFSVETTDLAMHKTKNDKVKYSKRVKTNNKKTKKNSQQTTSQTNSKVNASNEKLLDYKKQNDKDRKIDTGFTIDKTTPKVTVTYDNNNAVNGKYFPQARTATIKIKEHNFTKEHNRIVINRKAYKDGSAISGAPISAWKEADTNVYKATIPYTQDGDYQFGIDVTDKAGNKVSDSGVNYPNGRDLSKDFVIDQSVEKPIIGGVENGKSYPEKCIPTIQVNDTNYESSEVKLLRTQKDDIDRDVTSKYIKSMPENGSTVSEDYFDKLKANDGIYKLSVNITDMAGNTDSEEVAFTVNRFGSVYEFSKDLVDLQDSYVNKVDGNIFIREFNPDRLVEDSVELEVQRDQDPVENVKYDVSPEVNKKVDIGSSGWYQYKYDIANDNFKKDGIYTVNVKTKDDAGNTPESNNQSEIRFSVDTEKPDIVNVKGMESASVNAKEQKVDYLIHDSIGLKSIVVTVDGKEVANVADFADPTNYEGNFVIKEGYQRKVNFKITDLAGNVTNTADTDFNPEYDFNSTITVSTNIFLLWFANKWLFFGSLIGLAAIAAAIAYLIRRKMAGKIL